MPIYYDPESGEYFRANGNRVVEVKRMGDLTSANDPIDEGMDPVPMDDEEMTVDDEMPEDLPAKKGKGKGMPPKKGR